MTGSNVRALNHAVEDAQIWCKQLAGNEVFGNEEQGYTGLRAVLHSLRDRMLVDEAVHFSAQMPTLIRGVYFEGWRPALAPNDEKTQGEFLDSVEESLRNAAATLQPEPVTRAVLHFLDEKMDPGQIRQVKGQLPASIQQLWH